MQSHRGILLLYLLFWSLNAGFAGRKGGDRGGPNLPPETRPRVATAPTTRQKIATAPKRPRAATAPITRPRTTTPTTRSRTATAPTTRQRTATATTRTRKPTAPTTRPTAVTAPTRQRTETATTTTTTKATAPTRPTAVAAPTRPRTATAPTTRQRTATATTRTKKPTAPTTRPTAVTAPSTKPRTATAPTTRQRTETATTTRTTKATAPTRPRTASAPTTTQRTVTATEKTTRTKTATAPTSPITSVPKESCQPGYRVQKQQSKQSTKACTPCPVDTYKKEINGECKNCKIGFSTWGRKAVVSPENCTAENPIEVSWLKVSIAPADIKPGLIIAHFNASCKTGSLVIPPLTYMVTNVTKQKIQERSTDVTSEDIDSCSQPVSSSSFPFCIHNHNGSIATNKNFNCSEGDTFVISITVSDSGNDTIGKIVNPNGTVTISCVDVCKDVRPLYEKASNACPKTNLTVQTNGTRQVVVNGTNIHAIYEIHITNITSKEICNSFNISMKYGLTTVLLHYRNIKNHTSIVHPLEHSIIVTGPVINIRLFSHCRITSANLTLVVVPKHPEKCTTSWTCIDTVFNLTNSLNGQCESDPDNLRMRYGHCFERLTITRGPESWSGPSETRVNLSCIVTRYIPASITWYRGANEMNANTVTMNVNNQGYYWCKANNTYETAKSRRALLVVTDYFTSLIRFKTKKEYPKSNQNQLKESCESCTHIFKYLSSKDNSREYKNGQCRLWKWNNVECVIYGKKKDQDVNRYYNNLVNILTEGAKKNKMNSLKIYWKTILVKDAVFCRKETTGKQNIKGFFIWEAARIGETRTAACPLSPDGSNATRKCGGNFNTGAEWNTPDDDSCEYKSQKTKEINKISKIKVNSGNAKEVANNFTKIFKSGSVKNMSEADASIAADIVAKIVEMDDQLNETADMVVEIINTMMEMNASILPANASTKIVQALNTVAEKIPLEEGATSRVLNSTNLAIQANEVTRSTFKGIGFGIKQNTKEGRSVVTSEDQTNLFIKLPKSTLNRSRNASARIGFIYFANHNLFQVKPNDEEEDEEEDANKREASKEVLSGSVYDTNTSKLMDNVTLTFPKPIGKGLRNSSCVFWNVKELRWSDEGCSLCDRKLIEDNIKCCCNHLTSFAVLFSPETKPLSEEDKKHAKILSIISYIGCGISLVGVVLTFLTYSLFRHLRKNNQQPILMNLCVAMALLLIVFAVGVESTNNRIGCQIVAGLLHYLTLVTVLWMGIEAYNLYLQLVKVMAIYHRKFMLKASIVAWGVPGIIVIATVVAAVIEYNRNEDGNRVFYYGNDKVCILHNHLYRMISWFAPILAILFFNVVMFVLVIYKLNFTGAMVPVDTKSNQKKRCWTAVAIMSLLGVTWLFGALVISDARLFFEYLFCIFNSFQGIFIFFFHCVRLKEVRNQWSFFMSGLGFNHKESGSSQPRSRGIGESHHSSEAPYVKVKKWTNKESEAEQPERKIAMVTLVNDKNVNLNNDNQVDIELDVVKDHENVALDESFGSQKRDLKTSIDSTAKDRVE